MLKVSRVRLGLFHLLFQFVFKILDLLDKLKKAVSFRMKNTIYSTFLKGYLVIIYVLLKTNHNICYFLPQSTGDLAHELCMGRKDIKFL